MKKINHYNFLSKNKLTIAKKNPFKYIVFIILLIISILFFENYQYTKFFNNFKNNFINFNYAEANNSLIIDEQYNPIKIIKLKNDLSNFFNSELLKLSNEMKNNSSNKDILIELNEIQRYSILPFDEIYDLADSSDLLKDSISNYNNGLKYFSEQDYAAAISAFSKVSPLDLNYNSSLKYIVQSRDSIKQNVFEYCDELMENDYYSKAISTLEDNSSLINNDNDIKEKISEIKNKQQAYYDKNSEMIEASSKALVCDITTENINELDIESNTKYLVNVSLKNQKTYVYKGKKNNWTLIKVFPCSTGITGEETPVGSFTVKEKGDWFFSNKYNQGGKYWTQIVGDILFHSVPFSRDKKTVVDYTLNKPSSHGCIRLSISDSKWIYTNIPKGSKVLIK